MTAEQTVQVFSLGEPKKGTPKDQRRYRVKWAVDGRHKTRSFKTKQQAERLRSFLLQAVRDGLRFDVGTGEPTQWYQSDDTWWSWSSEWYGLKWEQWAGKSRKSGAEPLVAVTPYLLRRNAPLPPPTLADWLWQAGYRPKCPEEFRSGIELDWLLRWSAPLAEIDARMMEGALRAATTKRDGRPMAATSTKRRRDLMKAVFTAAERRDLIERNPMDKIVWRAPRRSIAIDVSTVPSTSEVLRAVEWAASLGSYGAQYAALYALVGLAGLRPSEAARLTVADLDLPESGWGLARAKGATTSPGARYTNDGFVREDKSLKHRDETAVRLVPLPPAVVRRLRLHMSIWTQADGRLLANANHRPVTADNWGPAWNRVRRELWPAEHVLAKTTVYQLRHTAATTMLRANVSPAEAARRLGHSVDVLMRVYAGVFEDEAERSNRKLDQFFNTE